MPELTKNIAAIISARKARLVTEERPIPIPDQDELLIRNYVIAANPVDWKIQDYELFLESYPSVLGSDVCGQVVSVGSQVKLFKPGDRVAGFAAVIHNSKPDHGAWQTYTVLRELAITRIPDSMSFESGSKFPYGDGNGGHCTLCQSRDLSNSSAESRLGRAMGYEVFGTASRSNFGRLKDIGAHQLFDYHDADVEEQIVAAAKKSGKPIKLAFDPISKGQTFDQVPSVVRKSVGKGKVAIVLPWPSDKPGPEGVEVSLTLAMRAGKDQSELGAWLFNDWLAKALESGIVKPAPPIEIICGGLEKTQEVLDTLKAGVSGKKLVLKVA